MNEFDLKKYLTENKITHPSKLLLEEAQEVPTGELPELVRVSIEGGDWTSRKETIGFMRPNPKYVIINERGYLTYTDEGKQYIRSNFNTKGYYIRVNRSNKSEYSEYKTEIEAKITLLKNSLDIK